MSRPKLLFLSQALPYPPDAGVKIRTFHVLKSLARDFDITALCFYRWKEAKRRELPSGSELVRKAARLAVQEALDAEQRDFIGRERYERGPGRGYRSGYRRRRLDTAEGRLEVQVPQVREPEIPYRSRLFDFLRGNSDVLERLAVECTPGGFPPGTSRRPSRAPMACACCRGRR